MASSISPQEVFSYRDVFAHTLSFVNVSDFFNVIPLVCKEWNQFSDALATNHHLWKGYSESKGIPMVSTCAGTRNCRDDFRVIYPATVVSGEVYRKIFGEPMGGEVPCIRLEIFNKLPKPGAIANPSQEIFELIVEYPGVRRVLDRSVLVLDATLTLKEADSDGAEACDTEQTLTAIPFSLFNRIMLAKHPLMEENDSNLFGYLTHVALRQCDYCPTQVNVYYQTRKIYEGAREMPYSKQKEFLEERGLEVMSLGPRLLSDVVQIIQFGTCPDNAKCFARTSSQVYYMGHLEQVDIGGFTPTRGVEIHISDSDDQRISVVAGGLAEVL
jgi:hypothetical protein